MTHVKTLRIWLDGYRKPLPLSVAGLWPENQASDRNMEYDSNIRPTD
jgi:hypothetical protein